MPGETLLSYEHRQAGAEVLVVTANWPVPERPAYGIFVKRQVESLIARGVALDVLLIRGYRSSRAYASAAGRLLTEAPSRRYKVIHAHGGEAGLAARGYFLRPLVISYSGSDILGAPGARGDGSPRRRLRRALVRENALTAQAIIVKSRDMLSALPARARPRAEVIPNGVDLDLFAPTDRLEAREQLGWPAEARIALFAADPSLPYKRHGLAREACERAQEAVGPIHLEVAFGVSPERMPLLMSAADCLIHPSASEGSPNVVKEAMACNLPIVATPVGDIPERLAGVPGCFVCAPDADELAAALARSLASPSRTDARQSVAALGLSDVAERIIAVYDRVSSAPLRRKAA